MSCFGRLHDARWSLAGLVTLLAAGVGPAGAFSAGTRAVAALNHPIIVTIHSAEQADGVHFLTMELVAGASLDTALTDEGLRLARFLELAMPPADALLDRHPSAPPHGRSILVWIELLDPGHRDADRLQRMEHANRVAVRREHLRQPLVDLRGFIRARPA